MIFKNRYFLITVLITVLSFTALTAETITYPGDYTAGALIDADGMNTRFSRVYNLVNGNLDTSNIADGGVDTINLANDAVDSTKLAADAVDTAAIADDAVNSSKIAAGAVDTAAIADNAVNSSKIAAGSVEGSDIASDTIGSGSLVTDAASLAKVSGGLMVSNGSAIGVGITNPDYLLGIDYQILTKYGFRWQASETQRGGLIWHGTQNKTSLFSIGGNLSLHANPYNIILESDVGIRNTNPQYTLDVTGDIHCTGTVSQDSDVRLKENIEQITDPLDILEDIDGIYFNMIGSDKKRVGVLAQEVRKTLPEAVSISDPENEILSVSYTDLVPVLIEAVKTLSSENEELRDRIEALEER